MNKAPMLPFLMAGSLIAGPSFAQGSDRNITVLRMSGPQLGVRLEEVDKDVVVRLKLKEEKGALVTEVLKNSAAEKAGILKDDVIMKFQGESILTAGQLGRLVRDSPEGRKVEIDLMRGGAPLKVTASLEKGEWKRDRRDLPGLEELTERLTERLGKLEDPGLRSRRDHPRTFNFRFDGDDPAILELARPERGRLGITYTEIEGQLARYFKAPADTAILVNSVSEGSAAEKAGIKAGDLVVKLGGASIAEGSDLREAVTDLEAGKPTPVTVWREGRGVDLSVTVEAPRNSKIEAIRKLRPVS